LSVETSFLATSCVELSVLSQSITAFWLSEPGLLSLISNCGGDARSETETIITREQIKLPSVLMNVAR